MSDNGQTIIDVTHVRGLPTVAAAFQAALNTGKDVFIPRGRYDLSFPVATIAPGQRIFGEGDASIITNRGKNANASAIILAHEGCVIQKLKITPGTTTDTLLNGWGVCVTANNCTIEDLHLAGHRRGGIILSSVSNCLVTRCRFTDSIVSTNAPQAEGGYDIYCYGKSSFNTITLNECVSGCGVGIGCQTVEAGAEQIGNTITGNTVRNHPSYGIMAYISGAGGRVAKLIVTNNVIDNISGSTEVTGSDARRKLFYGAGIYLQGVDDFEVARNTITRTNTDRSMPRTGNDVPAAIGITNPIGMKGTISENRIEDCYYGIWANSLKVTASDVVTINGNDIRGESAGRRPLVTGIYVADIRATNITNNNIIGSNATATARAIYVRNSGATRMERFAIFANRVRTADNLIESTGAVGNLTIKGNVCRNARNYAIFTTGAQSVVEGNDIHSAANGIGFSADVKVGDCSSNSFAAVGSTIIDNTKNGVSRRNNRLTLLENQHRSA